MDLKLKSISWVGKNISQKFETMCQEVDNIVSQDTVKYVENQMQTMGDNVKKFYSEVVQDFLPPLDHGAQEVGLKRNVAIGSYLKSMIGIEDNSEDTAIKQSPVDLHTIDPKKNELVNEFSGLHLANQINVPISVDPSEGAESALISGQIDDILSHGISDVNNEENALREKTVSEILESKSLDAKDAFEASLFCVFTDCNKNTCGFEVEVSSVTPIDVVESQATQKVDVVCDNFADNSVSDSSASNTSAPSEVDFAAVSCEEKISEMGSASSTNSQLMESNILHDNSLENFPTKTVCFNEPVDGFWCVSDSSDAIPSTLTPVPSHEDKAAEVGLIYFSSVLSTESNGSSDYYSDELDYSGMETVELCDKVKLEDSCVMVDSSTLYAVSDRTRKLGSFKKRIQDAFASKKRLAKEYEQLAIWFGDSDMGPSHNSVESLLPSATSTTLDLKNFSTNHISDSEWELL